MAWNRFMGITMLYGLINPTGVIPIGVAPHHRAGRGHLVAGDADQSSARHDRHQHRDPCHGAHRRLGRHQLHSDRDQEPAARIGVMR
jgi:hypothetical protein